MLETLIFLNGALVATVALLLYLALKIQRTNDALTSKIQRELHEAVEKLSEAHNSFVLVQQHTDRKINEHTMQIAELSTSRRNSVGAR